MKNKIYKDWFTLVELIIVMTILTIISTVWFISYNWYVVSARDANRVSQISGIYKSLETYRIKSYLPLPEDNVLVYASWTIIWYQWYAWENVLNKIWYNDWGRDPLDNTYFTYYLTKDLRKAQIMAFMENESEITYNLIDRANAVDYNERYPKVYWSKLWIFTESWTNIPIQELSDIKLSGLDIVNTELVYNSNITDSDIIIWTWTYLFNANPTASCKRILETWWSNNDWRYVINPTWINLDVYCDMTTDWGWWTLVYKVTDDPEDLSWTLDFTEWEPNWDDSKEYKLSINYWKHISNKQVMAKNTRIDGKKWNDIENWHIEDIWSEWVEFSENDDYHIFNNWTTPEDEDNDISWTYYWNWGSCGRCVNYWDSDVYWRSDTDSPMVNDGVTSYDWDGIEWAWWTSDENWHRLSKMWVFLR